METAPGSLWTIDELGPRVARALTEAGYAGVASGRVRDVPDPRTIRYYTTLGLLDRPAGFRGRIALYGPRHLLQLVAIKRLQASGRTLAEIQAALAGATESALGEAAGIAREGTAASRPTPTPTPQSARSDRRAGAFWREACRPIEEPVAPASQALEAVRLGAEGAATLLLATRRPIVEEDLRVIRLAAAPLLELLRLRGLLDPLKGREPGDVFPTGPDTQEATR